MFHFIFLLLLLMKILSYKKYCSTGRIWNCIWLNINSLIEWKDLNYLTVIMFYLKWFIWLHSQNFILRKNTFLHFYCKFFRGLDQACVNGNFRFSKVTNDIQSVTVQIHEWIFSAGWRRFSPYPENNTKGLNLIEMTGLFLSWQLAVS